MIKNLESNLFSVSNNSINTTSTTRSKTFNNSILKTLATKKKKIKLTESQKIKKKFLEIEKTTKNHIKKYSSINSLIKSSKISKQQKEFFSKNLKNEKNRFSFLNIDLSRNYILKHKSTSDYNTLSTLSNLNKPNLLYQKNKNKTKEIFFDEKKNIKKLREKLVNLKKNVFVIYKNLQIKNKIFFEKIKQKNILKNEIYSEKKISFDENDLLLESVSEFVPFFD